MAGLLADYGVTAVFGVPGGQTLPLYYGILDEGNRIRHILMKDEIDATLPRTPTPVSAAVSEYATPPPAAVPSSLFRAWRRRTTPPSPSSPSVLRWRGIGWPPGTAVRAPKW